MILSKKRYKLIDKEEYPVSPSEKNTVIQKQYQDGNLNSDVDRIVLSYTDTYLSSPTEIIATLASINSMKKKVEYIQTIFPEGITTFAIDDIPLGYEKRKIGGLRSLKI